MIQNEYFMGLDLASNSIPATADSISTSVYTQPFQKPVIEYRVDGYSSIRIKTRPMNLSGSLAEYVDSPFPGEVLISVACVTTSSESPNCRHPGDTSPLVNHISTVTTYGRPINTKHLLEAAHREDEAIEALKKIFTQK